jgi:hypothetical protein
MNRRRLMLAAAAVLHASLPVGPSAPAEPVPETLTVTMPPASFITDEAAARDGVVGGTLTGAWWLLVGRDGVPTRYVWYSHNGQGLDPGNDEAALAGLEGIEVQLASGNRTAAQVATSTASAIDAHADYTAAADGADVSVEGMIVAADFEVGGAWADRGGGGALGCIDRLPGGSFAVTTGTVSQLIDLPAPGTRFRVHGYEVFWGDTHTGQIAAALYQGNTAADGTSQGAALVKHMGVTTGNATAQWVRVLLSPADTFTMDTANGRIFLARAGDAGSRHAAESMASVATARSWNYFRTGTGASSANVSWALAATGNITGSAATFPSTLPAQGTGNAFAPSFRLLYTIEPWVGSGEWRARVGTRSAAAALTSDIAIDFFVGLSFALPNVLGMELATIGAALAIHTTTGQPRVEAWAGGDAANDYTDATLVYSAPQFTGTATGWSDFAVPEGVAPIAASSRLWLTIKALNSTSEIAYDAAGVGQYSSDLSPAGYLNTSSETENPEGQGIATDGASPTASPLAPTTPPTNPPNYPGLRAQVRVPGFAVAA